MKQVDKIVLYELTDVAAALGIHWQKAGRMVRAGEIEAPTKVGPTWVWSAEQFERIKRLQLA